MKHNSIRWRLPFSYAGIALLAALSLGSIMLIVLNRYYTNQEKSYLQGNGQTLQMIVEDSLSVNNPLVKLQDTVQGLAFLSQTRIQVFDQDKEIVIDTGIPDSNHLISVTQGLAGSVALSVLPSTNDTNSAYIVEAEPSGETNGVDISLAEPDITQSQSLVSIAASPYGYEFVTTQLTAPLNLSNEKRSNQTVTIPLSNNLGSLKISDGPAYGRDIITSVTWAWVIAGVIAVILAGIAGLYASKMVTHPVLALSEATHRMKEGDLSTRVSFQRTHQTTEFVILADSFNGMAQRIENTISTLKTFVSDAAHELHTPLTALHTNLELALDEQNSTTRTQYLESAQEQSRRLEGLVSGLLDLSRIEAAGSTPIKTVLNPTHLIQQISTQFASSAEMIGQTFVLELTDEQVEINANEMQLRRILVNLLENAQKFTPPGGTITLHVSSEYDQLIIKVQDTGIGIPEEDLPNLFDRFHRGRNTSRYAGNGLGLAIVKALTEIQGGSVTAESKIGAGTTMTVSLPLATNKVSEM